MIDTVFYILKVSVAVAIAATFAIAINTLLGLITAVVFGNVVGEVIGIISCCLPFSALAVFSALGNACAAILAFLIAKKIFELTSWNLSSI